MSRTLTLLTTLLVFSTLAAGSALARVGGGGGGGGGGGKHVRPRPADHDVGGVVVADPQDPIDWLTDYDEACKQAEEGKRAILILITTEEIDRNGATCNFAANTVRRAVRDSKVVPLKLRPPVMLDTTKLTPDEVKQRQEAFKKAAERYEALAKGFGVSSVPSLVYAAPDAAKLVMQAAPPDPDIIATLGRLPEMIKTHTEALAKAGGEARPEPPKAGAGSDRPVAGKSPETKPPATADKPGDGKDDF